MTRSISLAELEIPLFTKSAASFSASASAVRTSAPIAFTGGLSRVTIHAVPKWIVVIVTTARLYCMPHQGRTSSPLPGTAKSRGQFQAHDKKHWDFWRGLRLSSTSLPSRIHTKLQASLSISTFPERHLTSLAWAGATVFIQSTAQNDK